MATPSPKDIALSFFSNANSGNLEAFNSIFSDNFTHEYLPKSLGGMGIPVRTRQQYLDMIAGWRSDPSVKSFQYGPPLDVIVAEDAVVVHTEGVALMASGKERKHEYIFIFRVKDGKIVSSKEFIDTKALTSVE